MASGVSLPTFTEREKLLHSKLNALVSAINAKFTAGVSAADLAWPLTAEGNLDMSDFNIVGGQQIWGFVNAAEYDTLDDAVSAAGTGGVVLVPPETTIVANGVNHSGSGATIIGSGPSSVIQLTSGASAGQLIACTSGTGVRYINLKFDGNTSTGTGQIGLDIQGCSDVLIHGCEFTAFSGAAVKLSAGCTSARISDCYFQGGGSSASDHIYVTDCDDLQISNVWSTSAGGIGVRMESSGATAYIRAKLTNVEVTGSAGVGIKMTGYNAVGSTSPAQFVASGVIVASNAAGNAVELGSAAACVEAVSWSGGRVYAGFAGGMLVNANGGSISGVEIINPATFCLDLDTSQYVNVGRCVMRDGTIGIDLSGTTAECLVSDNLINGCTSDVVIGGTDVVQYGNGTQVGCMPYGAYANFTATTVTSGNTGTGCSITIPANTLRPGMGLRCTAFCSGSGTDEPQACYLRFDGNTISSGFVDGSDGDSMLVSDVVFTHATTASYMGGAIRETENPIESDDRTHAIYGTISSLDLTASNTITLYMTATGGGTVDLTSRGLVVQLYHVEIQT